MIRTPNAAIATATGTSTAALAGNNFWARTLGQVFEGNVHHPSVSYCLR